MAKTILVCGHGPGISDAVARTFGEHGFSVALIARSAEKLELAAAALEAKGITAKAFAVDLSDPAKVGEVVAHARELLGPIGVVHWNAYASGKAGDLMTASIADVRYVMDLGITSLLATVQAALPDLAAAGDAGVLVTGGGLCFYDPKVDQMAVGWGSMGLAVAKAAQHKLTGLLAAQLGPRGIHVAEVTVLGLVKGTAFDNGSATIDPITVAQKFWDLYQGRSEHFAQIG
ncbi:MAG TPA: SDR family NAD(P)-dependent oxidoreductase [Kofleriaceae bacterium]|jgi:NADP-dependent 3-hydroxy acid dehydrogenase YdfG